MADDFDDFVRAQLVPLTRYAIALTGSRDAADDLVQETLVRVLAAWKRIHRDGNPVGYATTVMLRTYVSIWRKLRTSPRPVALIVDPAAPRDGYAPVDARAVLRHSLRTLPRLQHAVLVATYLSDHTDEQIAEMIGRSPTTVRSLRHRGLKTLRPPRRVVRQRGGDRWKRWNRYCVTSTAARSTWTTWRRARSSPAPTGSAAGASPGGRPAG